MAFKKFTGVTKDKSLKEVKSVNGVYIYFINKKSDVVRAYFTDPVMKKIEDQVGFGTGSFDVFIDEAEMSLLFEFGGGRRFPLGGHNSNYGNISELFEEYSDLLPLVQANGECWPFCMEELPTGDDPYCWARWVMRPLLVRPW